MSVEGIFSLLRTVPNPAVTTITSIAAKAWEAGALDVREITPGAPSAVFLLLGDMDFPRATIRLPSGWEALFCVTPHSFVSAVVRSASLAVDHFNNRYVGETVNAHERAAAYEAEYLLTAGSPSWTFNGSQEALVRAYPEGIRSARVRHLIYAPSSDIPLMALV